MKSCFIGCLVVAFLLSGCGGTATTQKVSPTVQRAVAGRFAAAVLRGDAAAARALLADSDDGTLSTLVQWTAARWKTQHASLRLPARRLGKRWLFTYASTRTKPDGSFVMRSGWLVVRVSPTRAARVDFFIVGPVSTRFGTHHDSQLLPSNR